MDLEPFIRRWRWSPRSAFPPSTLLGGDHLFTCGSGVYLVTNSNFGQGDPVLAVGWAESDYWAHRAWDRPPFRGDLHPLPPEWGPPPSLAFLGRPARLGFQALRKFEAAQPGAATVTLVTAGFRFPDGAFLSCEIHAEDGITYFYASPNPKRDDQPVAIEFELPERPVTLQELMALPRGSPRAAFPPSMPVGSKHSRFECAAGFYLMTSPESGDGDALEAVGWAESSHWAWRVWDNSAVAGALPAPPPRRWTPPSLAFLGRPADPSFGTVRAFDRTRAGAGLDAILVPHRRETDDSFLYLELYTRGGIRYLYRSPDPTPEDLPVAIEMPLNGYPEPVPPARTEGCAT